MNKLWGEVMLTKYSQDRGENKINNDKKETKYNLKRHE